MNIGQQPSFPHPHIHREVQLSISSSLAYRITHMTDAEEEGKGKGKYTTIFYKEASMRPCQAIRHIQLLATTSQQKNWHLWAPGSPALVGYSLAKPLPSSAFFPPCHPTVTLKIPSRYCRLWDNKKMSVSGLKRCQNPETTSKQCFATKHCFPQSHDKVTSRSVSIWRRRTSPKSCKYNSPMGRLLVQVILYTTSR